MAFFAEELFHIADITGAFIAGVVISNIKSSKYIESRVDISAYMMFAPIYFASIGICNSFGTFDINMLFFGLAFIFIGIITKIIGCGVGAKLSGFSSINALFIGIGMMPRAEVMLITVQKGIDNGFITPTFLPYALGLVVLSSIIAPVLLKITNKKIDVKSMLTEKSVKQN